MKRVKKLLAGIIAIAMVLSAIPFMSKPVTTIAGTESATVQTINSLKYDFVMVNSGELTSLKFEATSTASWNNLSKTVDVNGDGAYSVTFEPGASGMRNLGYVNTVADSEAVLVLTKVTVNGTYEISQSKIIKVGSRTENAIGVNIWDQGITDGSKIWEADNCYFLFKNNDKISFYADTATTEYEDAVNENIASIKYDFVLVNSGELTSLKFEATSTASWTNLSKTVDVNGDGAYSVTFEPGASGMRNLGYVNTVADSEAVLVLTKVTVNGTYEISQSKIIKVGSGTENAIGVNIWDQGITDGSKLWEADNCYFLFKNNDKISFYTKAVKTPSTDPAGPNYDSMTATNRLTASGDRLTCDTSVHYKDTGAYDGYIQSNESDVTAYLASDYVKVTYKINGTTTEDEIFTIQVYDTNWGGWADNVVKISESTYNAATGVYTAYLPVADIAASYTAGKTIKGINISFMSAETNATLLTYETLVDNSGAGGFDDEHSVLDPATNYITITEEELLAAGLQVSDWSAGPVKVYIRMTEGGKWSAVNAQACYGDNGEGKVSSKYLLGSESLLSKSGNAIQDNLIGNAGTGIYVFPDVALNTTAQSGYTWDDSMKNYVNIKININTSETDLELLGIVFKSGAKYPTDFVVPSANKIESATYDVPAEPEVTYKEKLQYAVDFVSKMDESAYQPASWATFEAVVDEAKTLLANASATEAQFTSMHAKLEKTKANMLFADSTDASNPLPFRNLTGDELVYEMGLGTNLGNTMDGHSGFTPSETAWQSAVTTKAYMKALHDAGYNTVRIPVTWGTMIDEDNGYKLNENWLKRVQEIVDYCVEQDMYAIINIHHDGAEQSGWLRVGSDTIDDVYYEYECVWRNIAEYFKDYDEHLIFESMNEITCMEGDAKNSADAIAYDTPIIMNLNQIFVNVVRSTGSNNTTRWLAAVSHYANNGSSSLFSLPTDSYNENSGIMFAAHIYKASTNTTWTYSQVYEVVDGLKRMANKFNVPMYLGEWGNRTYKQEGTETGYNDVARAYFCEIVTKACQVAGVVPCVWDQGFGTKGEYETGLYSYWNRTECRPIFQTIVDAMVRGIYLEPSSKNTSWDFTDIVSDPTVTKITSITTEKSTYTMTLGENITIDATVAPSDTNDVVLWSTDDDSIATVTRGIVRGRGIGATTIHAYSQSGDVVKDITIIVKAEESETPCKEITTNKSSYTIVQNKTETIGVNLLPVGTTDTVTFKSSNPDVVTVNSQGKMFGQAEGVAYITITASSGVTKTVKVVVVSAENLSSMDLALHILYNDSAKKYYGTELSEPVTVNGDGTYTVTFDLATELSSAGTNAGITSINNLTAIYIKDLSVTKGDATKSPVTSAKIKYDKVVVNDTELTIIPHDPAQAVNSGRVFDSGKPINAWDGSVVEEVSATNHVATFTTITNPTKISVTFTLSEVEFVQPEVEEGNPATAIEVDKTAVEIEEVGDTAEVTVTLTPADTDSTVIFTSSDASVVSVSNDAMTVDANGKVKVTLTAIGEGSATITVMTDNNLTKEIVVRVGDFWSTVDMDIEDASEEDVILVEAGGHTELPGYVLVSLMGKDVDLVIKLDNGVIWTINGMDISDEILDEMSLAITVGTTGIPTDVLNTVEAIDGNKIQITFEHEGEFGFDATITFNIGSQYRGADFRLYYYDETANVLSDMNQVATVDADGNVSFEFSHASQWVLVQTSDVSAGDTPILPYVAVAAVALVTGSVTFVYKRKRKVQA